MTLEFVKCFLNIIACLSQCSQVLAHRETLLADVLSLARLKQTRSTHLGFSPDLAGLRTADCCHCHHCRMRTGCGHRGEASWAEERRVTGEFGSPLAVCSATWQQSPRCRRRLLLKMDAAEDKTSQNHNQRDVRISIVKSARRMMMHTCICTT